MNRSGSLPLRCILTSAAITILSASALAQVAGSDWSRVQAIATGTGIRVSSQHRPTLCSFLSADEASLTCTQTRTFFFVPVTHRLVFLRPEVTSVKLSRKALSLLAGAAIGTGVGAGIGAAVDASAQNQVEEGHLVAVLGGLIGLAVGAGAGSNLDFLAGPTIYRSSLVP